MKHPSKNTCSFMWESPEFLSSTPGLLWDGVHIWLSPLPSNTVDGRNPASVDMVNIPLFTGFYTCQVVSRISSINSSHHQDDIKTCLGDPGFLASLAKPSFATMKLGREITQTILRWSSKNVASFPGIFTCFFKIVWCLSPPQTTNLLEDHPRTWMHG